MNIEAILNAIAACLTISGTALIWFDAQRLNRTISRTLLEISKSFGYCSMAPLEQSGIDELRITLKGSISINKRGFILLLLGFLCQLISSLWVFL